MSDPRFIYLMRHGAVPKEMTRRLYGRLDVPLSDFGRRQAASWRDRLAHLSFAAVITSPLSRSRETAQLATAGRDLPRIVEPAFQEIHLGAWEGLTVDEVEELFGIRIPPRRITADGRPEGGESFSDLAARVLPAFDAYATRFAGRPLLIVAHGAVNRVILARALALPLEHIMEIPQPYACCTLCAAHDAER